MDPLQPELICLAVTVNPVQSGIMCSFFVLVHSVNPEVIFSLVVVINPPSPPPTL